VAAPATRGHDLRSEISDLRVRRTNDQERTNRHPIISQRPLSKNSDITGQRHLNEQTRVNAQKNQSQKSGAAEFKKLAEQHLPPDHPLHPKNRPG
jgi:hypothetical protein